MRASTSWWNAWTVSGPARTRTRSELTTGRWSDTNPSEPVAGLPAGRQGVDTSFPVPLARLAFTASQFTSQLQKPTVGWREQCAKWDRRAWQVGQENSRPLLDEMLDLNLCSLSSSCSDSRGNWCGSCF
eukprot:353996-Chlamydomonas_euryale.AAC.2